MKIVVAGTGYVGLVTGVCLAERGGHHIVCVDVNSEKISMLKSGISPIYEDGLEELIKKNNDLNRIEFTSDFESAYGDADAVFIAVGTPERSDGSANLDYLKSAAKTIAENAKKDILVIIKSTVPIGTNEQIEKYINKHKKENIRIEVASNPEFLAQGSAVRDTFEATRIVIGVESEWAKEILLDIYKNFDNHKLVTNRNSAEMIKYASNDFLALKISYMNDIANLCEIVGADIEDVALGMSFDNRIGSNFLNAGIGYGGSCFPKDTKALHWLSNSNGYELKTIKAAIEVNEIQKLKLAKKSSEFVESFNNLKVAILGLTYKPGTDDLREAPSIVNIRYLLERGAKVVAFDPVGIDNAKKIFGDTIAYVNDIDSAILDAEMCFIMTEWEVIKNYDVSNYKKLMKRPLVFDGRNCYKISEMKDNGIEYYSIGR
ncbi:MAG: UDP-glucose/GDP-mannose dehydrogenase family protein [Peptostreptococcus porci]|uniref:UDP-glucose dehydrogenase family protein n=1 Tax=Peptostreptococcus porci TaxID=2652282 RepID=UPI002A74B3E6|nr:UDP-glucose/GDP-mannose dehydrogenase family protein [Peptostreptococcus porci]MDY2795322.1 UDP-glucose/GDP-mannose dehydrogenase family protein [Peptostreptococcus porci]MDY5479462.1 UDP-glucose/GDP-mannose dehydrogenase family protein [Peptostreptococcus porci]MDY6232774.1 UDP-glucose/GDP-mannose dehydrogenase family protein [Peptostreptococcus porci]